jgi:hypothetical protein
MEHVCFFWRRSSLLFPLHLTSRHVTSPRYICAAVPESDQGGGSDSDGSTTSQHDLPDNAVFVSCGDTSESGSLFRYKMKLYCGTTAHGLYGRNDALREPIKLSHLSLDESGCEPLELVWTRALVYPDYKRSEPNRSHDMGFLRLSNLRDSVLSPYCFQRLPRV